MTNSPVFTAIKGYARVRDGPDGHCLLVEGCEATCLDGAARPGTATLEGVNPTMQDPDTVAINTVRGLCVDAIQRACAGRR
jgi:hypothetical protein